MKFDDFCPKMSGGDQDFFLEGVGVNLGGVRDQSMEGVELRASESPDTRKRNGALTGGGSYRVLQKFADSKDWFNLGLTNQFSRFLSNFQG